MVEHWLIKNSYKACIELQNLWKKDFFIDSRNSRDETTLIFQR